MVEKLRNHIAQRPDLAAIYNLIPEGSRVLDLGCGTGAFLKLLAIERNVSGVGLEIDQNRIIDCIAAGVPVVQSDLNKPLIFDDKSFDFVVLSQTIQAVNRPDLLLCEMLRVGRRGVISFLNMGHWKPRLQLALGGHMPVTSSLPNPWYHTPNIHLATIVDFRRLCHGLDLKIESELPLGISNNLLARINPNLFAPNCVFLLKA